MIDLTTYALLRKQITSAASGVSDVRAEGDELVFVLADGREVRVAIPATEIRDAVVRDDVLVLTLEDGKEVVVDATLTQSGQAADAKVTGDAIGQLKGDIAGKLPKSPANWEPWTAEEQAAARERIGINKQYELIESFTLEEEVSEIYRTLEPDGTEYAFRDLTLQVYAKKASGASTFDCFITDSNNVSLVSVCSGMVSEKTEKTAIFSFERYGGYILPKSLVANSKNPQILGPCNISPASFWIANGTIKSINLKIRGGYSALLPVGTEIKIYGVRA